MSNALTGRRRPFLSVTRSVVRVSDMWRSLIDGLTDPYRPERHYMRGPGPKWRAKHGALSGARDLA